MVMMSLQSSSMTLSVYHVNNSILNSQCKLRSKMSVMNIAAISMNKSSQLRLQKYQFSIKLILKIIKLKKMIMIKNLFKQRHKKMKLIKKKKYQLNQLIKNHLRITISQQMIKQMKCKIQRTNQLASRMIQINKMSKMS